MSMRDARVRPLVMAALEAAGWKSKFPELAGLVDEMEGDLTAYMKSAGTGEYGDGVFDDDDAFEHVCNAMVDRHRAQGEAEIRLCELADAYLDAVDDAMEELGLIEWN